MSDTKYFLVLHDGSTVSKELFDRLLKHEAAVRPARDRNKDYTVKVYFGPVIWQPMSPTEQRLAGKCFAHMVATGLVPMWPVKWAHEYPKKYRFK